MFVQIKKRWEGERKSEYATHSDFRTIFIEHVQRLYLLALLLTGDHPTAERCLWPRLHCAQKEVTSSRTGQLRGVAAVSLKTLLE
jgi:hypothetical protein